MVKSDLEHRAIPLGVITGFKRGFWKGVLTRIKNNILLHKAIRLNLSSAKREPVSHVSHFSIKADTFGDSTEIEGVFKIFWNFVHLVMMNDMNFKKMQ